jgi:hypothetical protein
MRVIYGLGLFFVLLFLAAMRRRLPASPARLVMRVELPLAIHVRWRGGGMDDAVQTHMMANRTAYGPALADRLSNCPSGSREARLVWVPLIPFLTDEAIRARVREYALHRAEGDLRAEMESVLEEAKTW